MQFLKLCEGDGYKVGEPKFLREHPPGIGKYGYLNIMLGMMSYAEVPANFKAIFGVTGSLGVLPDAQLDILKSEYKVTNFSYFPSFWGKRNLRWDPTKLTEKLEPGHLDNHFSVVNTEQAAFQARACPLTYARIS